MSILLLHTILLESMDWDEEAVDEAVSRAIDLYREMSRDGGVVTAYSMKKELGSEYSSHVTQNIVNFFDACQQFKKQLEEDEEEEMVSWEDFVKRRSINFQDFRVKNDINSADDLVMFCKRMGVSMPGEAQLSSLFPKHAKNAVDQHEESKGDEKEAVECSVENQETQAQSTDQPKKRKQKNKGE